MRFTAVPTRARAVRFVPVALATLRDAAPAGENWLHEEKLDGYRIEAVLTGHAVHLISRNEKDWTARFPDVAAAVRALPVDSVILDGEIIAVDNAGAPSFQALQQSLDASELRNVRYHVFDVLALNEVDLRELPLALRREFLAELLATLDDGAVIQATREFLVRHGDPLAQACKLGIEGVVSKQIDGAYPVGRSQAWIKSKCGKRQEFVIVGYTDPQGLRSHFGALLLGVYDGDVLRYAGKVGTGFDVDTLTAIATQLASLEISRSEVLSTSPIPRRGLHWVAPQLVAEVSFTEWTADGHLRHSVFQGLRLDKQARDVRRED